MKHRQKKVLIKLAVLLVCLLYAILIPFWLLKLACPKTTRELLASYSKPPAPNIKSMLLRIPFFFQVCYRYGFIEDADADLPYIKNN